MKSLYKSMLLASLVSLTATASNSGGQNSGGGGGGGGGVPGITPAGVVEVRTLNEKIAAGGTVQAKFLFTQPRPISSTGPKVWVGDFSLDGVAAFSPNGDAFGIGVVQNKYLSLSIVSPDSDYGTNLDYPLLTLTMTVPASLSAGTTIPLGLADATFETPTGPLTLSSKPGVLTVGGSLSIDQAIPGGGTWPAGTSIRVLGTGFQTNTKFVTKMKTTQPVRVSPTEMTFVLTAPATLDNQQMIAINPDGSQVTYYSYLRGVPAQASSRALLQNSEPIFQAQTHGLATVGPLAQLAPGQFVALALQNPSPGPVVVTFVHQPTGKSASVTLRSGGRIVEDLQVLLGGVAVNGGDTVSVLSTSAVQMFAVQGDENQGTLKPFLPVF